MKWEVILQDSESTTTRLAISGGYLYRTWFSYNGAVAMVFVADAAAVTQAVVANETLDKVVGAQTTQGMI